MEPNTTKNTTQDFHTELKNNKTFKEQQKRFGSCKSSSEASEVCIPQPLAQEESSSSLNERNVTPIKSCGFFGRITQFFKKIINHMIHAASTVHTTIFIAVTGAPPIPERPN